MNPIYERIAQLCEKNDTDITKVCRELKIPRSSFTELKMGRIKTISADKIAKVADYFGVSALYITDGIEDDNAVPAIEPEEIAKVALFGGDSEVTDEMWAEVKEFVEFVKLKHMKKDS